MRFFKKVLKYVFYMLLIPVIYLVVSLMLSFITVNKNNEDSDLNNTIFLNTNGVHLDIILPVNNTSEALLKGLRVNNESYVSFGWGDENFYLNTPTWGDLTIKNAFGAMFLKSRTLIHLTKYDTKCDDWIEVKLSNKQLKTLNEYIFKTFQQTDTNLKIMLEGKGYSDNDAFYKANGSYSCLKTCNTWVNSALKTSGLKSCYWTPFDFGLINKYKKQKL